MLKLDQCTQSQKGQDSLSHKKQNKNRLLCGLGKSKRGREAHLRVRSRKSVNIHHSFTQIKRQEMEAHTMDFSRGGLISQGLKEQFQMFCVQHIYQICPASSSSAQRRSSTVVLKLLHSDC